MKKLLLSVAALAMLFCVNQANAQIEVPRPSPGSTVTQEFGLMDIEVSYFRPKKKGRAIFGAGDDYLQKYGEIWRTGANSGTKITFSDDISFGGKDVKAGEYMIYTVPGADSWDVMLYSDLKLGGNVAGYKTENEVLRVSVKPSKLSAIVETLTINVSDISEDNTTANLEIAWDKTAIKVPLKTSFDEAIMTSIKKNTKVNPSNYIAAANYYFNTDRDIDQALKWMDTYLALNPTQFWNIHTKAKMLVKKGDKKAAMATAQESLKLAKESTRGDFGYIKRNEDLIAELK